ncbi:metallophosphoesterase family protein [Paenibacillus hamazuiensis]|uniref:metallophosphoesterase family protein n=1 Tax=Paenibacillus hamazuiensis TaxID=2936508 RepID=UPI00200BE2F5|nr:metallophosphoesterase [Paenibacillus hamazuiensis]
MRNFVAVTAIIFFIIVLTACAGVPGTGPADEAGASGTSPAPSSPQSSPTDSSTFRFVVMGDSRGSGDAIAEATLRKLLGKVKELSPQPAFLLFTGDQVRGSSVNSELTEWKRIVSDYFPLNVVYPALGNHDYDEKVFSKQFDYLPSDQLAGYGRTVYYFDHGDSRFIVLNSNRQDAKRKFIVDGAQRDWLEKLLQTGDKKHIFVSFHIPAYPGSSHFGNSLDANPGERDALWAILDKYNVSAVFVGHEHNYSRREVDSSFYAAFRNKVPQLTIGGAGAPLYTAVKDKKNVVVGPKPVYHYMIVDVMPDKTQFSVYDINNNQIDSFER